MSNSAVFFAEQVSLQQQVSAFYYIFATMGVLIGVVAIALVDAGFSSRKNVLDTIVQKMLAAFISGVSFMVVGYGFWNYQYYQALSIENPLKQAISDWWFLGTNLTRYAHQLDPALAPNADTSQIFSVFFFCFAGLTAALIHGGGLERLKPAAMFAMSVFIGGVLVPAVSYLAYGSAGPLTNLGVHDFVGAYCLYVPVGIWALMLAWRLGPRLDIPQTLGSPLLAMGGVLMMLIAIPMFVMGCGFMVPGGGYFGPTLSLSGMGIIFTNVFMAFAGGSIAGGVIAYRKKQPIFILSGAVAGYISCSAAFDILFPWQALCLSVAGPFTVLAVDAVVRRLGIDEPKVGALTLGPACFSIVCAGVLGSGLPQGGYFGIADGEFAFQHALVTVSTQLLGLLVVALISVLSAGIVLSVIDILIGLRVPVGVEKLGLDISYWGAPVVEPTADDSAPARVA